VTALYQAHALGLIRFAYLMLGERQAAEDVVQEAFAGLYRRWAQLSDPGKALPYVRSSVLNGRPRPGPPTRPLTAPKTAC
jgi:DNA-directed RNA polymerase specialized sigma24 family protein